MLRSILDECKKDVFSPTIVVKLPRNNNIVEMGCAAVEGGAKAVIACNSMEVPGKGAVSGDFVFVSTMTWVSQLVREIDGKADVIACGGIFTPDDVDVVMNHAGAAAVQIYTAFVYNGLQLLKQMES